MNEPSESVRIVDWLATRVPAPPAALAAIIADSVENVECDRHSLPDHLVDAAVRILNRLGDGRESANDLLAADALITYAIEAAAEERGEVEMIPMKIAERIALIGVKQ
ncbi:MAG TPA: hypothetical protein VJL35_03195 [Gemmatimonadaceae bacterium]|jgi:hypothetical protein|nr:hypothetical protein [Gemmatimonadaceae bacterium]